MAGVPDSLKTEILSVLLSKVGGVRLSDFQQDFRQLTGHKIDFASFGFSSLIDILESIPDVTKVVKLPDNTHVVFGLAKETMFMNQTAKKDPYKTGPGSMEANPSRGQHGDRDAKSDKTRFEFVPNLNGLYALCFPKQPGFTRESVNKEFSVYGAVSETTLTERFVFVRYAKESEARAAMETLGPKYDIKIPKERANPRQIIKEKDLAGNMPDPPKPTERNPDSLMVKQESQEIDVYIGNLPLSATEDEIHTLVEKFDVISLRCKQSDHKRFAFASVVPKEAERLVTELNHFIYKGNTLVVESCYSKISTSDNTDHTQKILLNLTKDSVPARGTQPRGRGQGQDMLGSQKLRPAGRGQGLLGRTGKPCSAGGGITTSSRVEGKSSVAPAVKNPPSHDYEFDEDMPALEELVIEDAVQASFAKHTRDDTYTGYEEDSLCGDAASLASNQHVDTYDLYLGNFPYGTTHADLYALTMQFGAARLDIRNNQPPTKACAFIKFLKYEQAEKALLSLDGILYNNRRLVANFSRNTFAPEELVMSRMEKIKCTVSARQDGPRQVEFERGVIGEQAYHDRDKESLVQNTSFLRGQGRAGHQHGYRGRGGFDPHFAGYEDGNYAREGYHSYRGRGGYMNASGGHGHSGIEVDDSEGYLGGNEDGFYSEGAGYEGFHMGRGGYVYQHPQDDNRGRWGYHPGYHRGGFEHYGRGHDYGFSGRGGFDSRIHGRGGFDPVNRGRGGYDSGFRGRGGYDSGYRGRGGFESGIQGRGGYDSGYRGRGGYDSGNQGRGGYDSGNRGRGGYDSGNQGRGGYDSGNRGRGGYDSGNQGRGGYDSGNRGRGGFDSGNRGRGGFDSGNRGRGGFDSGNRGRGGYDSGNRGRGGYNTGNQEGGGYGPGIDDQGSNDTKNNGNTGGVYSNRNLDTEKLSSSRKPDNSSHLQSVREKGSNQTKNEFVSNQNKPAVTEPNMETVHENQSTTERSVDSNHVEETDSLSSTMATLSVTTCPTAQSTVNVPVNETNDIPELEINTTAASADFPPSSNGNKETAVDFQGMPLEQASSEGSPTQARNSQEGHSGSAKLSPKDSTVRGVVSVDTHQVSKAETQQGFIESQPNSNEKGAIETQPVSIETQPVSVETQPVSVETQQGSVETQPVSVETQQGSIETLPVSVETQQGSVETQQGSTETQQGSIETQQGSIETQQGSIETQPVSDETQKSLNPTIQDSNETHPGSDDHVQTPGETQQASDSSDLPALPEMMLPTMMEKMFQEAFPNLPMPGCLTDDVFHMIPTHIEADSKHHFWALVVPTDEPEVSYTQLQETMTQIVQGREVSTGLGRGAMMVEGEYCRCWVVGTAGTDQVKVFFVDWGNTELVPVDSLIMLEPEFWDIPPFAAPFYVPGGTEASGLSEGLMQKHQARCLPDKTMGNVTAIGDVVLEQ